MAQAQELFSPTLITAIGRILHNFELHASVRSGPVTGNRQDSESSHHVSSSCFLAFDTTSLCCLLPGLAIA
eukprot:2878851-Pleurochrysis_carterae.AAC.2